MWLTVLLVGLAVCVADVRGAFTDGSCSPYIEPDSWYPLFTIDKQNDNKLANDVNSRAYISPGEMDIKYKGNNYQRFMISVNGYVALLDDLDQPDPDIWPHYDNIQERDMINLFYAGTDISMGCGNVYWRISDNQEDIDMMSLWVKRASKFTEEVTWAPDTVMVVSYDKVDMFWDPCCYEYDDKKRSSSASAAAEAAEKAKAARNESSPGRDKRSHGDEDWPHGLNSYQMAIGSKDNGDGSTSTYVVFNYGSIGWIDWWYGHSISQAGFTQKKKGSIYDSNYSFTHDLYNLGDSGWPRKGVYVFQVDNSEPECDPAPGWFIWDWNPTENNYWYSNPTCP